MATLAFQQLPATCIILEQQAWLFTAKVLRKGAIIGLHTAELPTLTDFINDWQVLRGAGPVFKRVGFSQQFEPLSYEQAAALYRAELPNA